MSVYLKKMQLRSVKIIVTCKFLIYLILTLSFVLCPLCLEIILANKIFIVNKGISANAENYSYVGISCQNFS